MRQGETTLRPPFPFFVGVISAFTFPAWLLIVVIDLLGLRPSTAPLNYLWLGGVFWLISILAASPSLFFRLRFLEHQLQFRWFGHATHALPYSAILRFDFPAFSYGGLPPLGGRKTRHLLGRLAEGRRPVAATRRTAGGCGITHAGAERSGYSLKVRRRRAAPRPLNGFSLCSVWTSRCSASSWRHVSQRHTSRCG